MKINWSERKINEEIVSVAHSSMRTRTLYKIRVPTTNGTLGYVIHIQK